MNSISAPARTASFEGRLVFEPDQDAVDALYVRFDGHVADARGVRGRRRPRMPVAETAVPGRTDPVLGPITYAVPDTWNHDEPFTLGRPGHACRPAGGA